MDKTLHALALCIGLSVSMWSHAEISIVTVKKVEQDLYKTSDGFYIETSSCFVDTDGEKAVLDYEQYTCHNYLNFSSDKSCKVQYVFK